MQKKVKVLDIRFDSVTLLETIDIISDYVESGKKGYICTPNPEMLLEALDYTKFKETLNNSVLNIPDGIGILWAATLIAEKKSKLQALLNLFLLPITPARFKKALKQRVTGTDLLHNIAIKASIKKHKIFLLGAAPKVAEECAKKLKKKYPSINIVGTYSGSPAITERKSIINLVNKSEADILFVAFGAPKQEMWIADTLDELKTVKIAIGVGGAFDFIAEKIKRAPQWMQKLGLEWLFRLILQPSRIKRIINAVIVFPYQVIKRL